MYNNTIYGQIPISPPGESSFEEEAEAYAQTLEAQAQPAGYDDAPPIELPTPTTNLRQSKQKQKLPFSLPALLSLGRGSILKLSLLSEFLVYSMVWAVISLLKYEIPEETYEIIATATQPVFVWLLLMLLFLINAARQSSAQAKFKALVVDFATMADAASALESTWKKQCSLNEQANTVLAITLSYLLVYIVLA